MDKITRVLLLYSKLSKGDEINKTIFCFENSCSPRGFDRDIEDIRLFLSESFSTAELLYDREINAYYITGSKREKLEETEYLFVERLLSDTAVLRKDEFSILTSHLLSNTEYSDSVKQYSQNICNNYISPSHNKALLKMHRDLMHIIKKQKVIQIKYAKFNEEEAEKVIVPCDVKFDLGYLYLIGYDQQKNYIYPAYYRLDRIHSFSILRQQYKDEKSKVQNYLKHYANGITQMYGGDYVKIVLNCKAEYYPYVYDKFRNAEIISQDSETIKVKFYAFEDGFVKWLISQPQNMLYVEQPHSTQEKIMQEAQKIINKYSEVKKDGQQENKISTGNG